VTVGPAAILHVMLCIKQVYLFLNQMLFWATFRLNFPYLVVKCNTSNISNSIPRLIFGDSFSEDCRGVLF